MLIADRPIRTAYASANAPVLVTPMGPAQYRLLAGPFPERASQSVCCLTDPKVITAVEGFSATAEPVSRDQKMRLAVLLAPHLRAPAIAALLEHRDPTEVWRWGALGRASAALREAVFAGHLTATHARPLLGLSMAQQEEWAARAIRGRWSVRQLTAAIRRNGAGQADRSAGSADLHALETVLGERLGTAVRVNWPEDPAAQRSLIIDWYDVESLKGILSQLAAGPEIGDEAVQALRRQLVIPVQNADELAALTGHLTTL